MYDKNIPGVTPLTPHVACLTQVYWMYACAALLSRLLLATSACTVRSATQTWAHHLQSSAIKDHHCWGDHWSGRPTCRHRTGLKYVWGVRPNRAAIFSAEKQIRRNIIWACNNCFPRKAMAQIMIKVTLIDNHLLVSWRRWQTFLQRILCHHGSG